MVVPARLYDFLRQPGTTYSKLICVDFVGAESGVCTVDIGPS